MIKRIKSFIYNIKLKYYLRKIEAEMVVRVVKGEKVSEDYIWKRLDEMLNKKVPNKELNTDKLYIHDENWN